MTRPSYPAPLVALLRLFELETLRQLAASANARILVDFDCNRREHPADE